MSKYVSIIVVVILSAVTGPGVSAENYVNWKGGFWLTVPESWEKVDYRIFDRFLAYTDTGELLVIKATPVEFRDMARYKIAGRNWVPPVLANGFLYLRDYESLYCVDLTPVIQRN